MTSIKPNVVKIILAIVFAVTMVAWGVVWNQESSIISEGVIVKAGQHKNPLTIKGVVYFVTDKQLQYYEVGRFIFVFGCVADFALMAWLHRLDKKR